MNIPSPRPQKRARIEIVPLIDVMFFLLATFIMVSLSMVKNKGIPVHLPSASSAETDRQNDFASLTVSEDGSYFFNKEPLRPEDLPTRLAQYKESVSEPRIVLNGDKKAEFGAAVAALDQIRTAGILDVAIQTESKDKP
jgi:biopolymer transport protein ExbD